MILLGISRSRQWEIPIPTYKEHFRVLDFERHRECIDARAGLTWLLMFPPWMICFFDCELIWNGTIIYPHINEVQKCLFSISSFDIICRTPSPWTSWNSWRGFQWSGWFFVPFLPMCQVRQDWVAWSGHARRTDFRWEVRRTHSPLWDAGGDDEG